MKYKYNERQGMSNATKLILIVVMIFGGIYIYNSGKDETSPATNSSQVSNITKQEYIDIATTNCSKTEPASTCRCMYTELLDRYSVEQVFEWDQAVANDPENFKYTGEQLKIASDCMAV